MTFDCFKRMIKEHGFSIESTSLVSSDGFGIYDLRFKDYYYGHAFHSRINDSYTVSGESTYLLKDLNKEDLLKKLEKFKSFVRKRQEKIKMKRLKQDF